MVNPQVFSFFERYHDYWYPLGMTSEAVVKWRKNRRIDRDDDRQNNRFGLSFSDDETRALKNMKLAWYEQLIEMLLTVGQGLSEPIKIFQEMLVSLLLKEFEIHSSN